MSVTSITPSRRIETQYRPNALIVGSTSADNLANLLQVLSHMGGQKLRPSEARLWEESFTSDETAVSAIKRIENVVNLEQGPVLLPTSFDGEQVFGHQLLETLDQLSVVLFYSSPERYLLDSICEASSPGNVLKAWCKSARRMLDLVHRSSERIVLFNAESILSDVPAFSKICQDRFGLRSCAQIGALRGREYKTEIQKIIAVGMVAESAEAKGLLDELRAAAEPTVCHPAVPEVSFDRALEELRKLIDVDRLREENVLLLSHLQEVQRELEVNFLQLRRIEKQLAAREKVIGEARKKQEAAKGKQEKLERKLSDMRSQMQRRKARLKELKRELSATQDTLTSIRQSRSWRVTKPLRTINALLKRY